jgi:hypothetical protein
MGLQDELIRLEKTGRDAFSHLVCLTQAHTVLLQIELKERCWVIIQTLIISVVIAITLGAALLCLSLALAVALNTQWPVLGIPLALIAVAFFDILLASLLVLYARTLLQCILSLHLYSLKSWVSSLSSVINAFCKTHQ